MKKRPRTMTSCLVCRKRKSKCDRQRPICGSCRKKSIAHLCSYDDQPPVDQTQLFFSNTLQGQPQPPELLYPPMRHPQMVYPVPPQPNVSAYPPPAMAPTSYAVVPIYQQNNNWKPSPQNYFDHYKQPQPALSQIPPSGVNYPSMQHPGTPTYSDQQVLSPQKRFAAQHRTSSIGSIEDPMRPNLPSRSSSSIFNHFTFRESQDVPSPINRDSTSQYSEGEHSLDHGLTNSIMPSKQGQPLTHARAETTSIVSSNSNDGSKMELSPSNHSAGSFSMPPADSTSAILTPAGTTQGMKQSFAMPPPHGNNSISDKSDHTFELTKRSYSDNDNDPELEFVSLSIGQNVLRIAVNDSMNAFTYASITLLVEGSHWQQQGPLSYVGLLKLDEFTQLLRNFTIRLFESEQFSRFIRKHDKKKDTGELTASNIASGEALSTDSCDSDQEDIKDEDGLVTTKIQASSVENSRDDPTSILLPGLRSLYSLHHSKKLYFEFVAQNILLILPPKGCIDDAINKFFQFVYPFVPIIDEESFTHEIKALFRKNDTGLDSQSYYLTISIRSESQLNLAGQLLLIIRLGYMTLIPNNQTDMGYTEMERTLIKTITKFKANHYSSIVNLCISEENIQSKSTFKTVQGLTLLLFYRSVAPNDCLGLSGTDAHLLFGSIVNHALTIGLNRDPTTYNTINTVSKEKNFVNTWRQLWNHIINLDAMSSIYSGTPLKICNLYLSDVKPPNYDPYTQQVQEFNEKITNVCLSYRRIVNRITDLNSNLRVIDLLLETSKLEKVFLEIFGKDFFRDYICSPAPPEPETFDSSTRGGNEESLMKVHRFLLFINTRANLSCLYYLVVLHYERRLNEDSNAEAGAGIELFKIFTRSVVQLVYIMSYALDNTQELFGRSYDYILTSRIERSMIKTHNFVTSFFIRLINYKRTLAIKEMTGGPLTSSNDENFEVRCDVVNNLFTITLIEAELFIGHFRTLGKTYINSYRLYIMAFFVLKQCMENPEILLAGITDAKLSFFNDGVNLIQFLSNSELQSLCKLCEEFRLAKLELIRRQKNHQKSLSPDQKFPAASEAPPVPSLDLNGTNGGLLPEMTSSFDATLVNRAMYAKENTVNTYGSLEEKHTHAEYSDEVYDEQNMIGNDELLRLFELYGYLEK